MQRSRIASGLFLLGAIVLTVHFFVDYAGYQREREERSVELGQRAGIRVAEALDAELTAIAEHAAAFAREVRDVRDEQDLLARIRRASLELPLVLGVTVAFEPGRFPGRERFAPFFNKSRDEFQFVEDTYDYTDRALETAHWYTRVVDSGEARWSDPYYAAAAQAMLVDFGVPLLDEEGRPMGIVDYAITLNDFTRIVDELSVGESGYGFTYDQNGVILAHPDPDYVLETVFRLRDGKTEAILDKMRNDAQGVVQYDSTYTYRFSSFFFQALESTGWKSVLVFSEDDLLGASDQGRRKQIHLAMGAGTLVIALLVFLAAGAPLEPRRLWGVVVGISLVIVGNVVVVWALNLTTDFSLLDDDEERIVNKTILAKYVERYDRALHQRTQAEYHKVPTGVFVESYELSSFEASLIGRLWMKYPKDLYEVAPPAFYFPGVSAIESRGLVSQLVSEVPHDDHVLVTWNFRATLEQDFSYQQFPFEQNDIELAILYPDPGRHVMLVPDLESYEILNPSARPGLSANIRVPSSETIASFFSFEMLDYKTSFGNEVPVNRHPALVFNMTEKRIWLSPFIANIVPILIVALILFIVLCVSSPRGDGGRSGVTTMNVIQSSAGFLFILLLAHVNERNRIETPEIAYIELFYFSMYVLITLQSVLLAVSLAGADWRIFTWRDHLALKLAFWPLLLTTWFAVTLLRFY
ncbi:MAG: PDC sensor domain-containing protein [Myxococcota bacterium]